MKFYVKGGRISKTAGAIGGVLNMTKGERDTSKDRDGYSKYYNENAKIENAGE